MKINAKFLCREVVGQARNGEYEIPDGADIAEFMRIAAEENGTFVKNYPDFAIYVVNNAPAVPETVLHEGDRLMALMRIYGG